MDSTSRMWQSCVNGDKRQFCGIHIPQRGPKKKSERLPRLRLTSSIFIPGIGVTVWTQTQSNNRTEFHFKHQRCAKLLGSVVLFEVFRHSPCVNPFVSLCAFNRVCTFFFLLSILSFFFFNETLLLSVLCLPILFLLCAPCVFATGTIPLAQNVTLSTRFQNTVVFIPFMQSWHPFESNTCRIHWVFSNHLLSGFLEAGW